MHFFVGGCVSMIMEGERVRDKTVVRSKIAKLVLESIETAKLCFDGEYTVILHDVTLCVHADSDPRALYLAVFRALRASGSRQVGPYPELPLPPIMEYEDRLAEVRAALTRSPEMFFLRKSAWTEFVWNNNEPFGVGESITAYAERLARLIQARHDLATPVEDLALQATYEADFEGVRDIALSRVINGLLSSWVFGSELHRAYGKFRI